MQIDRTTMRNALLAAAGQSWNSTRFSPRFLDAITDAALQVIESSRAKQPDAITNNYSPNNAFVNKANKPEPVGGADELITLLQATKDDLVWLLSGNPTGSEKATLSARIKNIEDAVVTHNLALASVHLRSPLSRPEAVEAVAEALVTEVKRQNLTEDKDIARTKYRILVGVDGIASANMLAQAAIDALKAMEG